MYQHEIQLFCAVLPFWLASLHWVGEAGGKGKEQRLEVWGKSLSAPVVLGRWQRVGFAGWPCGRGAAGTWRQLRSSRCVSATDGAGTEGSTGSSVGWAVTCGGAGHCSQQPEERGSSRLWSCSFTATAGGKKRKLNQMSGFQVEDKRFWVCTTAEV